MSPGYPGVHSGTRRLYLPALAALTAPARYQARRAHETPLYGVMLDHHERFVAVYDDVYADRYGEWRPSVGETFRRFLDCGILAQGFLRVRCQACGHEVRVPWSCKRVAFCPSCAQRRSLDFAELVDAHLFEAVPYRHVVFTIPKLLRPIFLRERALLGELGRCAWKTVRTALRVALGVRTATPGAVTAIASLGDTANPHPHIHGMFSDGAWAGPEAEATFLPWPSSLDAERLTQLFRRLVLRMLVRKRRMNQATADRLLGWHHSGFSVYVTALLCDVTDRSWPVRWRRARVLMKLKGHRRVPLLCVVDLNYRQHKHLLTRHDRTSSRAGVQGVFGAGW